jgi:hypothetical protein
MPFADHMRHSVLQLHASGADCRIISDANTFFISSFLKSQGIAHCFSQVVSNPATWADGVLRVAPHTSWGHAVPCGFPCPENLCKVSASTPLHTTCARRVQAPRCTCRLQRLNMRWAQGSVVSRWMLERHWTRVCYVGDGAGDICGWCVALLAV